MTRAASRVLVIRHAKAGDRARWQGDDRLRPLSKKGLAQAEALVSQLRSIPIDSVYSSPYVRCRQTVEPLARARSLTVVDDEALAEGGSLDSLLERAARTPGAGWAACTHGDVLASLLERLLDAGLISDADPGQEKGGTWVLELSRSGIGQARYLSAPR